MTNDLCKENKRQQKVTIEKLTDHLSHCQNVQYYGKIHVVFEHGRIVSVTGEERLDKTCLNPVLCK